MKKTPLLAAIVLASSTLNASAIEFSANLGVGQDSNPHQLSDQFSPNTELFALARFKSHSSIADMFYWQIDAHKSIYPDDERASDFNVLGDLKFQHDFELFDKRFEYFVGVDYQKNDKTFVSKRTGAVATLGGVSFANRYDYEDKGYYLGLGFSSHNTFDYRFELSNRSRDYVDFEVANIDRLDHDEQTFSFNLRLNTPNPGYFSFDLGMRDRDFLERADRDIEGVIIDGTNLSYRDIISRASYVYQPEDNTLWKYSFEFINRYSNGTDYYESERANVNIEASYRLADYHLLDAKLSYQTYFFDDDFNQPYEFLEEDQIEKRGFSFMIEYTWIIATMFKTNIGLFANLEAQLYDSPDDIFDFQQHKLNLGMRWAID